MNRWFVASLALTGAVLAGTAYVQGFAMDLFPERVPTHWNARFEADAWTARENLAPVLWSVPAVMVAFCFLTWGLPRLSPKNFGIESFQATYYYVMALCAGLFAYMHGAILWGAVYSESHPTLYMKLFLGGMCLFFALMGNVLGKVRQNFWMGVRTPWTIANETVWNRTHRLAAWLFVGAGLGSFLLILALPSSASSAAFFVMIGSILAAAFIPVVYSAILYKRLERAGQL